MQSDDYVSFVDIDQAKRLIQNKFQQANVKDQSHCQVSPTWFNYRYLKCIKTAKHVVRRIKTYYIRYIHRDTWLTKHSRNLVKPNTYIKRDQILTQLGGENRSKT